jgi:hypothetical protein
MPLPACNKTLPMLPADPLANSVAAAATNVADNEDKEGALKTSSANPSMLLVLLWQHALVLIVRECHRWGRQLLPLLAAAAAAPHVQRHQEQGSQYFGQFQMGEAVGPKCVDTQPHEPIRKVPGRLATLDRLPPLPPLLPPPPDCCLPNGNVGGRDAGASMGLGSMATVAACCPPCNICVNRTDVGMKPSTPPPPLPPPLPPSPLGINVTSTMAHSRLLARKTRPTIGLGHPYDDNNNDTKDKNGWSCKPQRSIVTTVTSLFSDNIIFDVNSKVVVVGGV